MELSKACLVLLFVCSNLICASALKKHKDISDELLCLGCQIVVKELDFILSHKPTRGMGETVTRALRKVCDVHNFDKYELDKNKVNTVCKLMRDDEGMEAVLVNEYGRKHKTGKKTTYLDMTQMICGTVLKACPDQPGKLGDEKDGSITYDPDVEDFTIKQGKNVRVASPVKEATQPPVPVKPNQTSEHNKDHNDDGEAYQATNESKDDSVPVSEASSSKSDLHEEL